MGCSSRKANGHSGRIFTAGRWLCGDCLYELEHGPIVRCPSERQSKSVAQLERLFPLPPPEPKPKYRVV